jgi:hypothetical protein
VGSSQGILFTHAVVGDIAIEAFTCMIIFKVSPYARGSLRQSKTVVTKSRTSSALVLLGVPMNGLFMAGSLRHLCGFQAFKLWSVF